MSDNLPAREVTDEEIRRIAMECGKQLVEQIEYAHREMTGAVASWNSTRLSLRNTVFNAVIGAVNATNEGRSDEWIKSHEAHRRKMVKLRKAGDEAERIRKLQPMPAEGKSE